MQGGNDRGRLLKVTAVPVAVLGLLASYATADASSLADERKLAGDDRKAKRLFDLDTFTSTSDDYAHAWGTVVFKSKRKIRIRGHINDACPPDGWSALSAMNANLAHTRKHKHRDVKDKRGCPLRAKRFKRKFNTKRKITAVEIVICEFGGFVCDGGRETKTIKNPKVR